MPRVRAVRRHEKLGGGYSFGADFYPIWLTSRECLNGRCDLYSKSVTREIQTGLFGRPLDSQISTDLDSDYRAFAYPAFTDLLFWPAANLPFTVLRPIVAIVLGLLTGASVLLWLSALDWCLDSRSLGVTLLFILVSIPVFEGLYATQLGLLVGFLLAASIFALRRNQPLLAGILLALCSVKPQMILLPSLYLVLWSVHDWAKRRQFLIAFSSLSALLLGTSLLIWPSWPRGWLGVLAGYHRYAEPILVSDVLAAPFGKTAAGPASLLMVAILLVIAMILSWRNRRAPIDSFNFWLTLSLLLAITTVALLPGQAVHDHVVLLPGIFLLARHRRDLVSSWKMKALFAAGCALVIWPWITSPLVILLRPLLSDRLFYTRAVLGLPLRTLGMFPFAVLGLLGLATRLSQPALATTETLSGRRDATAHATPLDSVMGDR